MISRNFANVFAVSSIIVSSIAIGDNPTQASDRYKFICQKNEAGTPTTFAVLPTGEKRQFINWHSDKFTLAGYPASKRCAQVSARLDQYVASGKAVYITHGTTYNKDRNKFYPSVCVTESKGGACVAHLYNLKPGQDGGKTVRQLLELNRENFTGDPRIESGCRIYASIQAIVSGKTEKAEVICRK